MEASPSADVRLSVSYHPGQERVFWRSKAKTKVIAKGRRWGLTKGFANYAVERMAEGVSPGLWIDTVNTNIDRYVERYFVPILVSLPGRFWRWRQQKKELAVFGSKLDLRSADEPQNIEGFAYRYIILNEAGIILRNTYLWENTVRPMILDFNPDVLVGGTPKGKNLFFDLKTKATDRLDPRYRNWEFFHFTSYDNPYLDRAEIDNLVADMPREVARQEIFAEFLEDSAAVFRKVRQCIGSARSGRLPGQSYFMGVDLAKHVDFTVVCVLDSAGRQVYFNRINELDWVYQKKLIVETARAYQARVLVDSTGIGDPILDDLRREGIDVAGYKFDRESKRKLVESLMLSIEQEKIILLDEPAQTSEMEIFGYEQTPSGVRYGAPEGHHDDCVIGLALANWALVNWIGEPTIFAA
jgi:hypothetical protein